VVVCVGRGGQYHGERYLSAPAVLAVAPRSTTARLSARMPPGTILRFMRPLPPTRTGNVLRPHSRSSLVVASGLAFR
jgi:hypothetical protein